MSNEEFKEKFKAMYADVWKTLSPYLWKDELAEDEWRELIHVANDIVRQHEELEKDATELASCLLSAIERKNRDEG